LDQHPFHADPDQDPGFEIFADPDLDLGLEIFADPNLVLDFFKKICGFLLLKKL